MIKLPPIKIQNKTRNLQAELNITSRNRSAASFSPKSQASGRQNNLPIEMTFDRRRSIAALPGASEQRANKEDQNIAIALDHLDITQRKSENQSGLGHRRLIMALARN